MGRKKRKVQIIEDAADPPEVDEPMPDGNSSHTAMAAAAGDHKANAIPDEPAFPSTSTSTETATAATTTAAATTAAPAASGYSLTSHSGELVPDDIYVSEGSEDEGDQLDLVVGPFKLGMMRRGLQMSTAATAQNSTTHRQWTRPAAAATGETPETAAAAVEDDLDQLDPAQRAARLLQEKLRKQEEERIQARADEAESNAGRDPMLFSKRTAFDIRFDQIDDKPWERSGMLSDFFNYALQEEDWLEYAQQQLQVRQELMDAKRLGRPPDPNIVTVTPKTKQQPEGDTAETPAPEEKEDNNDDEAAPDAAPSTAATGTATDATTTIIGPVLVKQQQQGKDATTEEASSSSSSSRLKQQIVAPAVGGIWGAGAIPGSVLAKLIQDGNADAVVPPPLPPPEAAAPEEDDSQWRRGNGGPPQQQREWSAHPPSQHYGGGGYEQGGYDQSSYDQGGYDQGGYDQGGYDQGGSYYQGGRGGGGHYQGGGGRGGYRGRYDNRRGRGGRGPPSSYDRGGDDGYYRQGRGDPRRRR